MSQQFAERSSCKHFFDAVCGIFLTLFVERSSCKHFFDAVCGGVVFVSVAGTGAQCCAPGDGNNWLRSYEGCNLSALCSQIELSHVDAVAFGGNGKPLPCPPPRAPSGKAGIFLTDFAGKLTG